MNIGGITGSLNTIIRDIVFRLPDGTESFRIPNGIDALAEYFESEMLEEDGKIITGTDSVDNLEGTKGSDTILALDLFDTVRAGGGHDYVSGGQGGDTLEGQAGRDELSGGEGRDRLEGGGGADRLDGGTEVDRLFGGGGNDIIDGGLGADDLEGGRGKDTFVISYETTPQTDLIWDFEKGKDTIDLSGFRDLGLKFDRSDLTIEQRDSNGTLFTVYADIPLFGTPVDLFSVGLPANSDPEKFLRDADFIFSDKGLSRVGDLLKNVADKLSGGALNDVLQGLKGSDLLKGLAGDDTLEGGEGNDKMIGGSGDDRLDGGEGNDSIKGGGGNDVMAGGAGNDRLIGGGGDDHISGGDGRDTIKGGAGDDTIIVGSGLNKVIGGIGADVFVLTKDIASSIKTILQDFDVDEDRLVIDGVEISRDTMRIEDDQLTLPLELIGESVGSTGNVILDLWGGLFE